MQQASARKASPDESDHACPDADYGVRLRAANINPDSYLATDYLNHFNEAIMLLELVPDMPDMLAEASQWQPKGYAAHFMDSEFAAKELACEAYELAPENFRIPFDLTRRTLDRKIAAAIEEAERALESGDSTALRHGLEERCEAIRSLIGTAGGIINGNASRPLEPVTAPGTSEAGTAVMAQEEIDAVFGDSAEPVEEVVQQEDSNSAKSSSPAADSESELSQDDIDALFD